MPAAASNARPRGARGPHPPDVGFSGARGRAPAAECRLARYSILLWILFTVAVPATPALAGQDIPPIRNFLRVNDQFCTGGQPRPEHFQQLKADGVRAVINLRTPGEHRAAEEQAQVEALGMRYISIPVVFTAPADAQVDAFLAATDDPANRPAFIHCTAAIRVGAFWMIRRVLRDGWTVEAAEQEAEKVGLRESPHLNAFARSYIERHR